MDSFCSVVRVLDNETVFIIGGNKNNTIEDILISYEFQSGSYTRLFSENLKFKEFVNNYCKALSKSPVSI